MKIRTQKICLLVICCSLATSSALLTHQASATDYTWGGGDLPWTDTSGSGWNGGPPAAWVGDVATINSGIVTTTAENNENGVGIVLGGTGVLNTSGGYFAEYSSLAFVNGGTLTAVGGDATWGAGALGSFGVSGSSTTGSVINGSFFNVWDGSTFNVADVTGNADADLTISTLLNRITFQSSASLTKTGEGTLSLAANNVLNNLASITIAGGTLSQSTDQGWNLLNNLTLQGSALESRLTAQSTFGCYWLTGTVTVSGSSPSSLTTNGSGAQFINLGALGSNSGSTTFNVADVTSSSAGDLIVSTKLGNEPFGGAARLFKTGAGTMVLNAANTYTGGTSVEAGTLQFASGSLDSTAYVGLVNSTLQWGTGNSQGLEKIFIYNGCTGTLDTNGNDVTLSAIRDNEFNHSGSLVKTGAGVLTFTGSNSYTGSTTVSAGTLAAVGSWVASSGVIVESAGTLNPGTVGGIGTLATASTSIVGTLACDVDASSSDTLAVTGDLNITDSTLSINTLAEPTARKYTLASYTGALTGTFANLNLPAGYSINYGTGTNSLITISRQGTDYETWQDAYSPAIGLASADDDRDGLSNFQEYAFGLNAASGASVNPINSGLDKTSGTFTYTRRAQALTGLTYSVWCSTDLESWTPATVSQSVTAAAGDVENVQVTFIPIPTESRFFFQVRAN